MGAKKTLVATGSPFALGRNTIVTDSNHQIQHEEDVIIVDAPGRVTLQLPNSPFVGEQHLVVAKNHRVTITSPGQAPVFVPRGTSLGLIYTPNNGAVSPWTSTSNSQIPTPSVGPAGPPGPINSFIAGVLVTPSTGQAVLLGSPVTFNLGPLFMNTINGDATFTAKLFANMSALADSVNATACLAEFFVDGNPVSFGVEASFPRDYTRFTLDNLGRLVSINPQTLCQQSVPPGDVEITLVLENFILLPRGVHTFGLKVTAIGGNIQIHVQPFSVEFPIVTITP